MTNSLSNMHAPSVTNEPVTLTEMTKSSLMKGEDSCLGKRGRAGAGFRRNFSIESFESDSSLSSPSYDMYPRSSTPGTFSAAHYQQSTPISHVSSPMGFDFMQAVHILPPPAPSNFRREPISRANFHPLDHSNIATSNCDSSSGSVQKSSALGKDANWGWFVDAE